MDESVFEIVTKRIEREESLLLLLLFDAQLMFYSVSVFSVCLQASAGLWTWPEVKTQTQSYLELKM